MDTQPVVTPTASPTILEPFVEADEPQEWNTDELVSMIESARDLIAEAAETLRAVANETNDSYRSGTMVANLQVLVETGGWCALEGETLQRWIDELTTKEEA